MRKSSAGVRGSVGGFDGGGQRTPRVWRAVMRQRVMLLASGLCNVAITGTGAEYTRAVVK